MIRQCVNSSWLAIEPPKSGWEITRLRLRWPGTFGRRLRFVRDRVTRCGDFLPDVAGQYPERPSFLRKLLGHRGKRVSLLRKSLGHRGGKTSFLHKSLGHRGGSTLFLRKLLGHQGGTTSFLGNVLRLWMIFWVGQILDTGCWSLVAGY